jgi:hypothetical protein
MKYMLLMYADESKVPQTSEAFQAAVPRQSMVRSRSVLWGRRNKSG